MRTKEIYDNQLAVLPSLQKVLEDVCKENSTYHTACNWEVIGDYVRFTLHEGETCHDGTIRFCWSIWEDEFTMTLSELKALA